MDELDKYKEAFRIACHTILLQDRLLYGGTIIKEAKGEKVTYTDKYYSEMEELHDMYLKDAENLLAQRGERVTKKKSESKTELCFDVHNKTNEEVKNMLIAVVAFLNVIEHCKVTKEGDCCFRLDEEGIEPKVSLRHECGQRDLYTNVIQSATDFGGAHLLPFEGNLTRALNQGKTMTQACEELERSIEYEFLARSDEE